VLLRRRRADEAIQQFRECLKMSAPEAAQVELAAALQVRGETDEARVLLQHVLEAPTSRLNASYDAVEEQPERLKAAAEYGRLEADAGNYVVARPWLEKALDANPYDTLSRYSYAVCLRGLGEQSAAKQQFEKVRIAREAMDAAGGLNARIQRDPNDLAARLELGKLILEHESPRTGLYWIRSIFPIDADYLPAHDFLAEYFASQATDEPGAARLATYHHRRADKIRKAGDSPPP
jgi:tetratricopeptide (TPR) repeat protein